MATKSNEELLRLIAQAEAESKTLAAKAKDVGVTPTSTNYFDKTAENIVNERKAAASATSTTSTSTTPTASAVSVSSSATNDSDNNTSNSKKYLTSAQNTRYSIGNSIASKVLGTDVTSDIENKSTDKYAYADYLPTVEDNNDTYMSPAMRRKVQTGQDIANKEIAAEAYYDDVGTEDNPNYTNIVDKALVNTLRSAGAVGAKQVESILNTPKEESKISNFFDALTNFNGINGESYYDRLKRNYEASGVNGLSDTAANQTAITKELNTAKYGDTLGKVANFGLDTAEAVLTEISYMLNIGGTKFLSYYMGYGTMLETYEEDLANGVSKVKAAHDAVAKGAISCAVEQIGGLGSKKLNLSKGSGYYEIENTPKAIYTKAEAITRYILSNAFDETVEEWAEAFADLVWDKTCDLLFDKKVDISWDEAWEIIKETAYGSAVAGVTGGLFGAAKAINPDIVYDKSSDSVYAMLGNEGNEKGTYFYPISTNASNDSDTVDINSDNDVNAVESDDRYRDAAAGNVPTAKDASKDAMKAVKYEITHDDNGRELSSEEIDANNARRHIVIRKKRQAALADEQAENASATNNQTLMERINAMTPEERLALDNSIPEEYTDYLSQNRYRADTPENYTPLTTEERLQAGIDTGKIKGSDYIAASSNDKSIPTNPFGNLEDVYEGTRNFNDESSNLFKKNLQESYKVSNTEDLTDEERNSLISILNETARDSNNKSQKDAIELLSVLNGKQQSPYSNAIENSTSLYNNYMNYVYLNYLKNKYGITDINSLSDAEKNALIAKLKKDGSDVALGAIEFLKGDISNAQYNSTYEIPSSIDEYISNSKDKDIDDDLRVALNRKKKAKKGKETLTNEQAKAIHDLSHKVYGEKRKKAESLYNEAVYKSKTKSKNVPDKVIKYLYSSYVYSDLLDAINGKKKFTSELMTQYNDVLKKLYPDVQDREDIYNPRDSIDEELRTKHNTKKAENAKRAAEAEEKRKKYEEEHAKAMREYNEKYGSHTTTRHVEPEEKVDVSKVNGNLSKHEVDVLQRQIDALNKLLDNAEVRPNGTKRIRTIVDVEKTRADGSKYKVKEELLTDADKNAFNERVSGVPSGVDLNTVNEATIKEKIKSIESVLYDREEYTKRVGMVRALWKEIQKYDAFKNLSSKLSEISAKKAGSNEKALKDTRERFIDIVTNENLKPKEVVAKIDELMFYNKNELNFENLFDLRNMISKEYFGKYLPFNEDLKDGIRKFVPDNNPDKYKFIDNPKEKSLIDKLREKAEKNVNKAEIEAEAPKTENKETPKTESKEAPKTENKNTNNTAKPAESKTQNKPADTKAENKKEPVAFPTVDEKKEINPKKTTYKPRDAKTVEAIKQKKVERIFDSKLKDINSIKGSALDFIDRIKTSIYFSAGDIQTRLKDKLKNYLINISEKPESGSTLEYLYNLNYKEDASNEEKLKLFKFMLNKVENNNLTTSKETKYNTIKSLKFFDELSDKHKKRIEDLIKNGNYKDFIKIYEYAINEYSHDSKNYIDSFKYNGKTYYLYSDKTPNDTNYKKSDRKWVNENHQVLSESEKNEIDKLYYDSYYPDQKSKVEDLDNNISELIDNIRNGKIKANGEEQVKEKRGTEYSEDEKKALKEIFKIVDKTSNYDDVRILEDLVAKYEAIDNIEKGKDIIDVPNRDEFNAQERNKEKILRELSKQSKEFVNQYSLLGDTQEETFDKILLVSINAKSGRSAIRDAKVRQVCLDILSSSDSLIKTAKMLRPIFENYSVGKNKFNFKGLAEDLKNTFGIDTKNAPENVGEFYELASAVDKIIHKANNDTNQKNRIDGLSITKDVGENSNMQNEYRYLEQIASSDIATGIKEILDDKSTDYMTKYYELWDRINNHTNEISDHDSSYANLILKELFNDDIREQRNIIEQENTNTLRFKYSDYLNKLGRKSKVNAKTVSNVIEDKSITKEEKVNKLQEMYDTDGLSKNKRDAIRKLIQGIQREIKNDKKKVKAKTKEDINAEAFDATNKEEKKIESLPETKEEVKEETKEEVKEEKKEEPVALPTAKEETKVTKAITENKKAEPQKSNKEVKQVGITSILNATSKVEDVGGYMDTAKELMQLVNSGRITIDSIKNNVDAVNDFFKECLKLYTNTGDYKGSNDDANIDKFNKYEDNFVNILNGNKENKAETSSTPAETKKVKLNNTEKEAKTENKAPAGLPTPEKPKSTKTSAKANTEAASTSNKHITKTDVGRAISWLGKEVKFYHTGNNFKGVVADYANKHNVDVNTALKAVLGDKYSTITDEEIHKLYPVNEYKKTNEEALIANKVENVNKDLESIKNKKTYQTDEDIVKEAENTEVNDKIEDRLKKIVKKGKIEKENYEIVIENLADDIVDQSMYNFSNIVSKHPDAVKEYINETIAFINLDGKYEGLSDKKSEELYDNERLNIINKFNDANEAKDVKVPETLPSTRDNNGKIKKITKQGVTEVNKRKSDVEELYSPENLHKIFENDLNDIKSTVLKQGILKIIDDDKLKGKDKYNELKSALSDRASFEHSYNNLQSDIEELKKEPDINSKEIEKKTKLLNYFKNELDSYDILDKMLKNKEAWGNELGGFRSQNPDVHTGKHLSATVKKIDNQHFGYLISQDIKDHPEDYLSDTLDYKKVSYELADYFHNHSRKEIVNEAFNIVDGKAFTQTDYDVEKVMATITALDDAGDIEAASALMAKFATKFTSRAGYTLNAIKRAQTKFFTNVDLHTDKAKFAEATAYYLSQKYNKKVTYDKKLVKNAQNLENNVGKIFNGKKVTEDDVGKAWDNVYTNIANQIPATFWEHIDTIRYWAMLSNPKTHIKNVLNNSAMYLTDAVKDSVKGIIESAYNNSEYVKSGKKEASRTIGHYSKKIRDFASNDFNTVKETLKSGKYFGEVGFVKEFRKNTINLNALSVFANKSSSNNSDYGSFISNLIRDGVFNSVINLNSNMLNFEDNAAEKAIYTHALANYISANNIDIDHPNLESVKVKLSKARAYALNEALYNTFNEDNKLANKIKAFSQSNKLLKLAIDAELPFAKVPLNVLKTAVDYNPIHLVTNSVRIVRAMNKSDYKLDNPNAVIDSAAKGMTGAMLVGIGAALRWLGYLNLEKDENKKVNNFNKTMGLQEFSINTKNGTYTLDWLDPVCVMLFSGASAYDALTESGISGFTNAGVSTIASVLTPFTELTVLADLKDMISGNTNKSLDDVAIDMASDYITSFIPNVLYGITRTFDDSQRNAYYVDKTNNIDDKLEKAVNIIKSKIPTLAKTLPERVDSWGETMTTSDIMNNNIIGRAIQAFVSPGTYRTNKDKELNDFVNGIYQETGDTSALPSSFSQKYDFGNGDENISASDWVKAQKAKGTLSKEIVSELMKSEKFKNLTSAEKLKILSEAYSLSTEKGKSAIRSDYDTKNSLNNYEAVKKENVDSADYFLAKLKKNAISDDDEATDDEKKNQFFDYINGTSSMSSNQKLALLEVVGGANFEKYHTVADTDDEILKLYDAMISLDEDGNSNKETKVNSVNLLGYDDAEALAIVNEISGQKSLDEQGEFTGFSSAKYLNYAENLVKNAGWSAEDVVKAANAITAIGDYDTDKNRATVNKMLATVGITSEQKQNEFWKYYGSKVCGSSSSSSTYTTAQSVINAGSTASAQATRTANRAKFNQSYSYNGQTITFNGDTDFVGVYQCTRSYRTKADKIAALLKYFNNDSVKAHIAYNILQGKKNIYDMS